MEKKKLSTKDMAYIGLFACLMAICAWISIPGQIPFTLQTMGVFLAVGLLGGKRGTLAVLVYVLMGAVGLPVFSGFTGGIGRLLGATGGYIIGFLASALLMWALEKVLGEKKWGLALSMLLGLIACYAFGTAWFLVVYTNAKGAISLAAVLGEESVTLEDICEPYLMQMGMLTRTPRGRCVTRLAYEHLHMAVPRRFDEDDGQQSMF